LGDILVSTYNVNMAESSNENAGKITPPEQFEIPKTTQGGQEALTEQAIEKRQISETTPAKKAPRLPVQATPALPQQATPPQQSSDQASPTSSITASLPAQDTDLIEKEWVERAKTIVSKTLDDPYKQKSEMSKIKADYIKKRFDKTIPLDDSAKT
jgi:hypothetical protein